MQVHIDKASTFLQAFKRACLLKQVVKKEVNVLLDGRGLQYCLRSSDGAKTRMMIPLGPEVRGDLEQIMLNRDKLPAILGFAGRKPVTFSTFVEVHDPRNPKKPKLEPATTWNAQWVRIEADTARYDLPCSDPILFPIQEDESFPEDYVSIYATDMARLIDQTLFATDEQTGRYALGGAMAELHPHQIRLITTNGRQMALATSGCEIHGTGGIPPVGSTACVVGAPVLRALRGLLDLAGEEGSILMARRGSHSIVFACPEFTLESPLVEGRFPAYANVIPDRSLVVARLVAEDREPILRAVRLATICTSDDSKGVDFLIEESGELGLFADAPDVGECEVGNLPIEVVASGLAEIALVGVDLQVALSVIPPGQMVKVELIDSKNAIRITTANLEIIQMPLTRENAPRKVRTLPQPPVDEPFPVEAEVVA